MLYKADPDPDLKKNLRGLISNKTLLFSNSSPKTPKSGIIGPKFRNFIFS